MGLRDLFKQKQDPSQKPIPPSEREYYLDDCYYPSTKPTAILGPNNYHSSKVITFPERKKISFPSKSGLYVAEILLLQYCSYGTYPHPKNGYPRFWWFEYGIRNIGEMLSSLEKRGYIKYATAIDTLPTLTIPQLKALAVKLGVSTKGKKADIIGSIVDVCSDKALEQYIVERKYQLTEKGRTELDINGYVPYMHKHSHKTIENANIGFEFNVWSINRIIGKGDSRHWSEIVQEQERLCIQHSIS